MRDVLDEAGPFHEGELSLQRATGERATGAGNGRIIADHVIPQAVGFIARQELAIVATIEGDGRLWCSALVGPPGSFTVPDLTRLALDRTAARTDDPLWSNVHGDPRVGLLFIETASRRRYRVNGRIVDPDADPLVVEVSEALPNCPKYISRRHLVVDPANADAVVDARAAATGREFGNFERQIIAGADSCFVASANPTGLLDASHRGGRPGFVELHDGGLWIPDYPGNSMFNTLGNLSLHPAAGLLFVDFAGSQTLQLTGTTTIDLDVDAPDAVTGGTHRGWTFTPTAWRQAPLPRRLHADLFELSPFNP
jgi:predicted pyridoxine 5'-phosphate oxidase superfamily flavin-nucleotide-binding protein